MVHQEKGVRKDGHTGGVVMTTGGEEPSVSLTKRYSVKETAAILGVSRNTVGRLVSRGELHLGGMKPHGRRLYPFYYGRDILKYWRKVL